MAFKSNVESVLRFDSKPVSWRKSFIMFALALCYLALIFYPKSFQKELLPVSLAELSLLCVLFIFALWYGKRNSKKRYLVFTDTELKQVSIKKEFVTLWKDVKLVQINKNGQDKVTSLSILLQSGKLWNLSGYTDMDAVAKQVTKYAKTGRIDGILNSVRTKPWVSSFVGNALMMLVLLAWRLFPKQVPFELVFFPFIGLTYWLYPTKTGSDLTKRLLKQHLIGFLLLLGVIVIVFVLLVFVK